MVNSKLFKEAVRSLQCNSIVRLSNFNNENKINNISRCRYNYRNKFLNENLRRSITSINPFAHIKLIDIFISLTSTNKNMMSSEKYNMNKPTLKYNKFINYNRNYDNFEYNNYNVISQYTKSDVIDNIMVEKGFARLNLFDRNKFSVIFAAGAPNYEKIQKMYKSQRCY